MKLTARDVASREDEDVLRRLFEREADCIRRLVAQELHFSGAREPLKLDECRAVEPNGREHAGQRIRGGDAIDGGFQRPEQIHVLRLRGSEDAKSRDGVLN